MEIKLQFEQFLSILKKIKSVEENFALLKSKKPKIQLSDTIDLITAQEYLKVENEISKVNADLKKLNTDSINLENNLLQLLQPLKDKWIELEIEKEKYKIGVFPGRARAIDGSYYGGNSHFKYEKIT